jgi:hypothetical protein
MLGAISSISSLFVGSVGARASTGSTTSSARSSQASGIDTPQDVVAISGVRPPDPVSRNDPSTDGKDTTSSGEGSPQPGQKKLSQEQQDQVAKLKQIDRSVHAHEQAHAATGGNLAGAPHYSYTTGPDGNQYAVGGEVSISVPSVSSKDPQATIQQLRQVIAAATAPADPSGQDRAVAAQAQAEIAAAQAEAAKKSQEKTAAARGASGDDQQKTKTDKATDAPKTIGPQPLSADSTASKTDDAAPPDSIPVIGPSLFGTKTADKQTTPAQPSPTPNETTNSSARTSGRSTPIYAYQQAQSGFGQSRSRNASAISLTV